VFTHFYDDGNLRLFANSLPGALIVYKLNTDGSEELLFVSETALNLWEVNHKDVLANVKLIWEQIFPEDVDAVTRSILKSKEEKLFWDHTYRIKTESGKIKWLNGRGMPVKQNDGSTVWHTLILDVTDLKLLEQELQRKSDKLENYADKHSHDLRAPLASLLGLLRLIEGNHVDDLSQAKTYLTQLIRCSKQLDGVVREMANDLDF
jgi:PAS domain S-box-containing protein